MTKKEMIEILRGKVLYNTYDEIQEMLNEIAEWIEKQPECEIIRHVEFVPDKEVDNITKEIVMTILNNDTAEAIGKEIIKNRLFNCENRKIKKDGEFGNQYTFTVNVGKPTKEDDFV